MISDKNINKLITEIKTSESLSKEFYSLYETEYPGSLSYSYNSVVFKAIFTDKNIVSPIAKASCMYLNSNKVYERNHLLKQNEISLSLKLDDKVSSYECLNWLVYNDYNWYKHKTAKKFMEDYYIKNFKSFSTNEMAGLILHMKNPSLYNPYKRKERFESAVNFLVKKYKKSMDAQIKKN